MTSSMMYVEFVACYEVTGQAMWLNKFMPILRVVDNIKRSLKLYCDNEPAVLYVHNNKMIADPFMKGLTPSVFREHFAGMGLRESL
jgi:hypothetical protein